MNRYLHISHFTSTFCKGFTFVEILAAMLFMAIVVPVAMQGITIANRTGVMAERSRVAAQLADNKLTEIILTEAWRNGEQQGDFSEELDDIYAGGYRWILETHAWDEDAMRLVIIRVYYTVQEKEYDLSLCTIVEEEKMEE